MTDTLGQLPRKKPFEVLTVVVARGNSKRLPNKNLRLLGGKPLVVWAIENALNSKLVTRVVLSTESDEIAEIGKAAGAEVPFKRPAVLAADNVSRLPVVLHSMTWLQDHEGYEADLVHASHPTSPFADPGLIDRCVELIIADPLADSVHTVYENTKSGLHPYRAWKIAPDGRYSEPFLTIPTIPRPYDVHPSALPTPYVQNSHVAIARWSTLMERKSYYGDRVIPYVMTANYDLDIDTIEDLARAERHLRALEQRRGHG